MLLSCIARNYGTVVGVCNDRRNDLQLTLYRNFLYAAGLDSRLTKAIAFIGWVHPTLVQAQAIPLALSGRDLVVRASTGSGKTAAFGLPLL